MRTLKEEVATFQAWAATQPGNYGEWETGYKGWSALRAAAGVAIATGPRDDDEIHLLLFALARDNECELIREMLEEHPATGMMLARSALTFPDPDARWQAATFLGSRPEEEARFLLHMFIKDADEYVRRRALLACTNVDPEFAKATALAWIASEDEYSRLAALSVLQEVGAPELKAMVARLKNDPSPYVRQRADEIEGAV